jgi:hypothetical protein
MDGQGRPEPERVLAQAGKVAHGREQDQRDAVQEEHRGQRHGNLVRTGPQDGGRGRDGAAAANGGPYADQEARVAVNLEEPSQQQTGRHDEGQADRGVADAVEPHPGHRAQVHLRAQAHHCQGQQAVRPAMGHGLDWVAEGQGDHRSANQRRGGGSQGGQGEEGA